MVRTRANGGELEIRGLKADLLALASSGDAALAHELARDFTEWGIIQHDAGLQLGARIEHKAAVEAAAGALLSILGKDGADGIISLGAAGRWYYHKGWHPVAEGVGPLDFREGVPAATK